MGSYISCVGETAGDVVVKHTMANGLLRCRCVLANGFQGKNIAAKVRHKMIRALCDGLSIFWKQHLSALLYSAKNLRLEA